MRETVPKTALKLNSLFKHNGFRKVKRKPPGHSPGTAIHTGTQKLDDVLLTVHDFDTDHYESIPITKIEKSESYLSDTSKTWIQVRGLHDINKLKTIWDYFGLHPLVQEDIVNTTQRPKVEPYPDAIFIVLQMITLPSKQNGDAELHHEQVSLVIGKDYVLSFQETDSSVFEPIFKRLEMPTTRLRRLNMDYLAYTLIDNIVDHYFHALDLIDDSIEHIEEQIIARSRENLLQDIHSIRRDLIYFKKSIWSLRDGIHSLIRDDFPLISDEVKVFYRDVYNHIVQAIDTLENHREMVYSLYDIYMSGLSNRMNEVMKVLTIIATIFIPLTFITGIYGMNFDPASSPLNMPELTWYWGYPASLLLMTGIVAGMLFFFKQKGWL